MEIKYLSANYCLLKMRGTNVTSHSYHSAKNTAPELVLSRVCYSLPNIPQDADLLKLLV